MDTEHQVTPNQCPECKRKYIEKMNNKLEVNRTLNALKLEIQGLKRSNEER